MYFEENSKIFLDGDFVKVAEAGPTLFSQTLHYGNGVFEGLRAYETNDGVRLFKAREHFSRLISSAKKVHLPVEYSVDQLIAYTYSLLKENNLTEAYVRPLIFAGNTMELSTSQTSHVLIAGWYWKRLLGKKPLKVMISSYKRPYSNALQVDAKVCGHYVNTILAATEAKNKGFNDAILLDGNGYVAGGTGTNIFVEKNEVIYTPPMGQILPGITRMTIIEIAQSMGIEIQEERFSPEFMLESDGAFLTGTAAEVVPIGSIEGHQVRMKWEDTLGFMLSRQYRKLVTSSDRYDYTLI